MDKMENFKRLVETFKECANQNDKSNLSYLNGKAVAFRYAALWLKEEIELYEKENA